MAQAIPEFFIYGEPVRPLDPGFMHVETISARQHVHNGHISPHKHPQMGHITFWTTGRGIYRIEEETWDFSAPSVAFVPSNVVHSIEAEKDADAIVLSMSDGALHAIAPHTPLPLDVPTFCLHGGDRHTWRRLRATIDAIVDEYVDQMAGVDAILPSLIAIAFSHVARLRNQAIAIQPTTSLVMRLRRLIDQHFRDDWRTDDYVRALGTTPHILDNAARHALGKSVAELVMDRRILEAKRLLTFTTLPLEDIAYELGFADPSYFSRFFRRRVGVAPSAWRSERLARR